ncbi:T6SS effector amidase Tae4 family protein [Flavobacterium sp.]|uniref:T6SS effector amidase Tae4 family protein n=1 Tax=Flavobacterium sp. TaxID=239 RepID=UPI0031D8FA23
MNTKMKWVYLFTLIISFTFQSCEKDLNDETQTKDQAKEGVINHLTIKEVPFLQPNVENFRSNNSLTNKSSVNKENEIQLDLQHIIEYDGVNDFKSYTIPVIDNTVESEEYYFENLHVLKDGDKYESFIVRYFPKDKTKKFELNHFTGSMQFFDDTRKLRSTLYFENGGIKNVKAASSKSIMGKLPDQMEDEGGCGCSNQNGLLSQFFSWISGLFSNIHISLGSGGTYMPGDGIYSGDYYLSITPTNGGSDYYTGNGNSYSGGSSPTVVFVPSQAQAEYQRMQVVDITRKLNTVNSKLNSNAFLWLIDYNNADNTNLIYNFLNQNEENTPDTLEFVKWSINYMMNNPSSTFEQCEKWFLGSSEGKDGSYDSAYWDNPNLTFIKQNLPTWKDFEASFPKDTNPLYNSPEKMYKSIGGTIATFYSGPDTNTCAIRLSKALNYSGVKIPYIPGQTYSGADGKFYFKSAYQINIWMRKTFGTNPATKTTPLNDKHFEYSGAQAGIHGVNLPSLLKGKKGIFSIYSSDFRWASGHADLLYSDATCGNKCHFYDAPIFRLDVWILN